MAVPETARDQVLRLSHPFPQPLAGACLMLRHPKLAHRIVRATAATYNTLMINQIASCLTNVRLSTPLALATQIRGRTAIHTTNAT